MRSSLIFIASFTFMVGLCLKPCNAQVNPWTGGNANVAQQNPYARQSNPYNNPRAVIPVTPAYGYAGQPNGYGYPSYGAPVAVGGNFYAFNAAGRQIEYWRSPSGYYYPWAAGLSYPQQIVLSQQGSSQPAPSLPPVSTIFMDMQKFLDQEREKGKLTAANYEHLNRRLHDVMSMSGDSSYSESEIRGSLDQLGAEMSRLLHS